MVLRPLARRDALALRALYRRLPAADWVRHLGVCDGDDRGFAARAASVGERGGHGVVAEVAPDGPAPVPPPGLGATDAPGTLVGECHYEAKPGGAGELVLVVDPGWRDWLGPRLFDAVLDAAAARGVANLEIEVMRGDDWLVDLVGTRGRVVLPTGDDWLSARAVVGTAGGSPVWVAPRPRVLVESPIGRWHAADAARAAGLSVMICTAPDHGGALCPLGEGIPCSLVTGADVVVVSYPPDAPEWDALIAAHRDLHPDVPVCVEGCEGRPLPPGVTRLDVHDPAEVVERVAALAAGRTGPG
ncbi:MAG TPA: hypothetical protein VFZ77_13300 [Acidimicrobiales bacterium]